MVAYTPISTVLDEPLVLEPNQKLRVMVEPIEPSPKRTDFSQWIGLAARLNQKPYDPVEEDALWDRGFVLGSVISHHDLLLFPPYPIPKNAL